MSEQTPGRLPEHPAMRRQVWRGFSLDDSAGQRIHIAPLPETIIAHLSPTDIRVHAPESVQVTGRNDEWYVWEDIAVQFSDMRPRLFEEPDGSRVLAFHLADDHHDDALAYEWNIDTDDPARSGWKPQRYSTPVDEWAPQTGRLVRVLDDIADLCSDARAINARAVAAAAPEKAWDTAAEIDDLIDWLRNLQDHINERFSAESGTGEGTEST